MKNLSAPIYLLISASCLAILLVIFIVDMSLILTYTVPIIILFMIAGYTLGCGIGKIKNEE